MNQLMLMEEGILGYLHFKIREKITNLWWFAFLLEYATERAYLL